MTFYLFSTAFRSWGSVERGPTYFTCLLQIPVHHHSGIYSPALPLKEGHRIQAFSRYPCLVQLNPVPSPSSTSKSGKHRRSGWFLCRSSSLVSPFNRGMDRNFSCIIRPYPPWSEARVVGAPLYAWSLIVCRLMRGGGDGGRAA